MSNSHPISIARSLVQSFFFVCFLSQRPAFSWGIAALGSSTLIQMLSPKLWETNGERSLFNRVGDIITIGGTYFGVQQLFPGRCLSRIVLGVFLGGFQIAVTNWKTEYVKDYILNTPNQKEEKWKVASYASERLSGYKDFMLKAIERSMSYDYDEEKTAFQFASEELKTNRDFALQILKIFKKCEMIMFDFFKSFSENFKEDKIFFLEFIEENRIAFFITAGGSKAFLKVLPEKFRNDEDFMLYLAKLKVLLYQEYIIDHLEPEINHLEPKDAVLRLESILKSVISYVKSIYEESQLQAEDYFPQVIDYLFECNPSLLDVISTGFSETEFFKNEFSKYFSDDLKGKITGCVGDLENHESRAVEGGEEKTA